MLNNLTGKEVTIYIDVSAWGNSAVSGKILEVSDDWVKIQCKKSIELIAVSTIKKVSYNL